MTFARAFRAALAASVFVCVPQGALAAEREDARIADLQRQVDELRAIVRTLQAERSASIASATTPATPVAPPVSAPVQVAAAPAAVPAPSVPAAKPAAAKKAWYEKLQLRGYTQLRLNEIVSGPKNAASGLARIRSVQDSGVNDTGNFSIRRARLVVQGDISDRVSLYLQGDFAGAVNNQSANESRQNFFQLRDAYADLFLDKRKTLKVRLGQSKVPFGWENLQSSSNRIPLDRTDAINAPVPGERDLGVVAYYTPPSIQKIWDELSHDGQKLFGNYGAFGVGVYNGQGTNRVEKTEGLMTVAMATMPFRLDGLGDAFRGQVAEIGVYGLKNKFRPEIRAGGVSTQSFQDDHIGFHAMLYPKPIGFQAEWSWGKGPQWDSATGTIRSARSTGGYVMALGRIKESLIGQIMPFARWQTYRGGWKAAINAPRLETDEYELGVEWLPLKELEFTFSWANVNRAEADERRSGRAKGDILRTQVQWNY